MFTSEENSQFLVSLVPSLLSTAQLESKAGFGRKSSALLLILYHLVCALPLWGFLNDWNIPR